MRQITLRECQLEILSIAKIFHEICVKNGIPYYILYGTLLGAVRHKGFIPWDDDIDFGVPRKYYDNLAPILEKELDPVYRVLTYKNRPFPFYFIRIENTKTLYNEPANALLGRANNGIFIEVFPLDDCSSDVNKIIPIFAKKSYSQFTIANIIYAALFMKKKEPIYKSAIRSVIKAGLLLYKPISYWKEWFMKQHLRIIDELHATGNDAMTNFIGNYNERDMYPKEVWGTPTLYKFEDTEFYGVENYDAYLSHLFGDYMTLPPENERHFHGDSFFIL